MSPPILISPSCTMPSPLTSATCSSEPSTCAQLLIQAGSWSKRVPTSASNTSTLTSTASAGAVTYSSTMKNSDHATDTRASRHRRRRVEAREHVRQRRGAHHQAEHEREEVAARVVEGLARGGVAVRVAGELLRVRRHAGQRPRAFQVGVARARPLVARGVRVARHAREHALGGLDVALRRVGGLEVGDAARGGAALDGQRGGDVGQAGVVTGGARLEDRDHLLLGRVGLQALLGRDHLLQLVAVGGLRHRRWRAA